MGDFNDFDFEEPYEQPDDPRERAAREYLDEFFSKNQKSVFFGNQLAVQNENEFFHWVTHRAVTGLVQDGLVKTEKRKLATGSDIKLFWHKRHRYYKRDAKRIVDLVDEYGSPTMCAAIGLHAEQMVLAAFARKEFVMRGYNTREYRAKKWTESQHNLDFIFELDEKPYGVEVKNTLSYMDRLEFLTKMDVCERLGVVPVFAARMLPRTWIHELIQRGGYAMILKYQLYPWTHVELARRVAKELELPIDAPKALADGTMERFLRWHRKQL